MLEKIKQQINVIKSSFDERDFSLSNIIDVSATRLPSKISHRSLIPFVLNQAQVPHCVGFGISNTINTYLKKAGKMPQGGVSPEYLYAQCKKIDGNTNAGTQIRNGLKIANKNGVCSWNLAPFNGNEPETYICKITDVMNKDAQKYKIKSYASLSGLQQIKQALANGKLVVIGSIVTSDDWNDGDAYIVLPDSGSNYSGCHCSVLIGYDDNKEFKGNKGFFEGMNSWSINWGEQGFYWMSYNFAQHKSKRLGENCLFEAWVVEM